jgi:hypothetical protein
VPPANNISASNLPFMLPPCRYSAAVAFQKGMPHANHKWFQINKEQPKLPVQLHRAGGFQPATGLRRRSDTA